LTTADFQVGNRVEVGGRRCGAHEDPDADVLAETKPGVESDVTAGGRAALLLHDSGDGRVAVDRDGWDSILLDADRCWSAVDQDVDAVRKREGPAEGEMNGNLRMLEPARGRGDRARLIEKDRTGNRGNTRDVIESAAEGRNTDANRRLPPEVATDRG